MGIYVNPGNDSFRKAVRSEIYVDKTELIACTNRQEVFEEYGNPAGKTDIRLADALSRIYARTGRRFIFFMDEWDCVMRERQESEDIQRKYMDFLRNLLKDRPYVELAYMTGILPVKKYGQHSALNMFWEYSMTGQGIFEEYTGFTHIEVCKLCGRYGMDFAQAGSWYDGYRFRKFHHIYNPKSVVEAMHRHQFANYWTSAETYDDSVVMRTRLHRRWIKPIYRQ